MNSHRLRACAMALVFASGSVCVVARADVVTRGWHNASPEQLAALGLMAGGQPFVGNGMGERVGMVEAGPGLPQTASRNANMPAEGAGAGQITLLARTTDPYDSHATMVAGVIIGGTGPHAPQSRLFAATGLNLLDWIDGVQRVGSTSARFGANNVPIINHSLSFGPFGATRNAMGQVVSLGAGDADGASLSTEMGDWAAVVRAPDAPLGTRLMVFAGNENQAEERTSAWDNFNGITVVATTGNRALELASYNGAATAIAGGVGTRNVTRDVSPYTTAGAGFASTRTVGRYKTDISAYGGGQAWGRALNPVTDLLADPVITNSPEDNFAGGVPNNGINSDPNFAGTSFASPAVAGSAAVLRQFQVANGASADPRVLKALLLNGASTTGLVDNSGPAPRPWGPVGNVGAKTKPGGVMETIQIGWDVNFGTGLLDLGTTLTNAAGGRQGPGAVGLTGWDLNITARVPVLDPDGIRTYQLPRPDMGLRTIVTTLDWMRGVVLNEPAGAPFNTEPDGLYQLGESFTTSTLNDLDLEVWNTTTGVRVAFSTSDMDSIEHVRYTIPDANVFDQFEIRVKFFNAFTLLPIDTYGLAWRTTLAPTPGSMALLVMGVIVALRRRR